MRKKLVLMAIFRNEAHILDEWIRHYLNEGVEHFYLFNHLSTDGFRDVLLPFLNRGLVEIFDVKADHPQIPSYNSLRSRIRREAEWLIVCDLDEFIFARRGQTIHSYLGQLSWIISEVLIPSKNFGSSRHQFQPKGFVSQNFLYRWDYGIEAKANGLEGCADRQESWAKYIVRTSRIRFLSVHVASIWYGKIVDSAGRVQHDFDGRIQIDERYLESSQLHLNHYGIQSREFFFTVKANRPDVNAPEKDSLKNMRYFDDFDRNEKYDCELSMKSTELAKVSTLQAANILSKYTHACRQEQQLTNRSAEVIVPQLIDLCGKPDSVMEVGGGSAGVWLAAFLNEGVVDVTLFDCSGLESNLVIDPRSYVPVDFTTEVPEGHLRADLAVCVGLLEFLPEVRAVPVVDWLTKCSDLILFSAAVPGQQGVGHVNSAGSRYWGELFDVFGYRRYDVLRRRIIHDGRIPWWHRQNLVLYSRDGSPLEKELRRKALDPFLPLEFDLQHHTSFTSSALIQSQQTHQPGLGVLLRGVPAAARATLKARAKRFASWLTTW